MPVVDTQTEAGVISRCRRGRQTSNAAMSSRAGRRAWRCLSQGLSIGV